MGRMIAAVVAVAIFVSGAMYWSQAEQLNTMPEQPLCPGVACQQMDVQEASAAAAATEENKDGCCAQEGGCAAKAAGNCASSGSDNCCMDEKVDPVDA